MKIAILIFGEYRTFETAVKTWNCRFWNNVDYYMSTWDTSIEPMERVTHLVDSRWETKVDEEFIRKSLPNVNLKVTSSDSEDYIKNHDTNKMLYHWKTLYNMVASSGEEYDCIFLIRPDTYFFVNPSFFEVTGKNKLYTSAKIQNESAHDIFFFGYGNILLEFLKNVPKQMDVIHKNLAEYLLNNFENRLDYVFKDGVDITYGLLRQTSTPLFDYLNYTPLEKNNLNPNFIETKFLDELRKLDSRYDLGLLNVLLIGESCKDVFIYGKVDRLSPEAPIPVINPISKTENEGMAGNVKTQFEELYSPLDFLTNNSKITKTRYVDKSTNYILLRVDEGDELVNAIDLSSLPNKKYDIIIFSDYDKGFISSSDIEYIIKYYKDMNHELLTFIDTKKNFNDWIRDIDFIKVNYKEYERNIEYISKNDWILKKLIVTRGPFGCDYNGKNYPNKEVPIKDLSGAGDTFLSSLVAKYIVTRNIESSIEFANKISEITVQRKGVSTVYRHEIKSN